MRVFLLDLWLDLREKRLAPVALAILALIVLVPLVLAEGEPEPPPPPPVAQTGEDASLPEVATADETVLDSRLESFDSRDPFEPVSAATTGTGGGTTTGGTSGGDTGGGDTSGGDTTTGTGTTGGGTTPSGGGDTGTGTGTGTGTTGTDTTPQRRTVFFTFRADVLFGEFGEERRRTVDRLEVLPDEDDPIVVFLGVTTSGKTAVFLVDQGVEASGEGACRPSRDECSFLYLRDEADRNTALLTAEDGTVYRLTLRDIDRVAIGAQGDGEDDRSGSGDNAPAFTGSKRDRTPPGEPDADDEETADRKSSSDAPEFADGARR